MKLNALTLAQIRSHTTFGAGETPYLDGTACPDVRNGLHRIRGVYAVDVCNAVRHDDARAWDVLMANAYIRT
jgi:hypothetical protein